VLDNWFLQLDTKRRGYIGGAEAVGFLSNSNLEREVLRVIWGLIDSNNTGYIDLRQFYKTIRLVSICCSSTHANKVPSMEIYYSTATLKIPLPALTFTGKDSSLSQPPSITAPVSMPNSANSGNSSRNTHVLSPSHTYPDSSWQQTAGSLIPIADTYSNHPPVSVASINTASQPIDKYQPKSTYEMKDDDDFEFSDFESAPTNISDPEFNPSSLLAAIPSNSLISVAGDEMNLSIKAKMVEVEEEEEMGDFIGPPQSLSNSNPNSNPNPHSNSNTKTNVELEEEEDMGDFMGPQQSVSYDSIDFTMEEKIVPIININSIVALSPVDVTAKVAVINPTLSEKSGSANERMSFFDDLIENDLKVGAEEWDEEYVYSNTGVSIGDGGGVGVEGGLDREERDVKVEAVNPFDMFNDDSVIIDENKSVVENVTTQKNGADQNDGQILLFPSPLYNDSRGVEDDEEFSDFHSHIATPVPESNQISSIIIPESSSTLSNNSYTG
jgi:hypothetical protein